MNNLKDELDAINKAERAGEVLVGFKGIGMLNVEKELIKICERIDSFGINYFLTGGVLLGLVRNGKLLEHDKDIDLGVMGDKVLDILYEGLQPYYEIVHFDLGGRTIRHGKLLWVKKYFKINGKYHSLPIEIQAHYKKGRRVFYNKDLEVTPEDAFDFKEGRLTWDKRLFENFGTVSLKGASLNSPSPVTKFLRTIYGKKWDVPEYYTDWRYHYKNLYKGYW